MINMVNQSIELSEIIARLRQKRLELQMTVEKTLQEISDIEQIIEALEPKPMPSGITTMPLRPIRAWIDRSEISVKLHGDDDFGLVPPAAMRVLEESGQEGEDYADEMITSEIFVTTQQQAPAKEKLRKRSIEERRRDNQRRDPLLHFGFH